MKLRLAVSTRTVTRFFVVLSVLLLLASIAVNCWTLYGNGDDYWFVVRIFDFDVKNNLPHAYKAILLLLSSLVLFWIASGAECPVETHSCFGRDWHGCF